MRITAECKSVALDLTIYLAKTAGTMDESFLRFF